MSTGVTRRSVRPRFGLPTAVMIEGLSALGVSMMDAAPILLSRDTSVIDLNMTARDEKACVQRQRAKLTHKWKQALPGRLDEDDYRDFGESVPHLLDMALARSRASRGVATDAQAARDVLDKLTGALSAQMRRALQNFDLAPDTYDTAIDDIMAATALTGHQKAELALMLFVVTGSLGDPQHALEAADAHSRRKFHLGIVEARTPAGAPTCRHVADPDPLCLLRLTGEHAIGWRHTLEPTADGTVIGSAPDATGSAILDVDRSVSPAHLHIYLDHGRWYARGLHSANGTVLTRGGTGETVQVEPPESERGEGYEPQPVEILPGDTLALGSTVFRVLTFDPA